MMSFDAIVIGGGIAGVSIGYELSADRSVCLLEMEDQLAFHTTGRSVATFLESYGGRVVRLLTTGSRAFMEDPPDGFGRPLLTALALLWVAPHGEAQDLRDMATSVGEFVTMQTLTADEVDEVAPVFRPGWVALGLLEPGASEIDVASLHGGYAGGLQRRGGAVRTRAGAVAITRSDGRWTVTDRQGQSYEAPVLVNAAGAWCDQIAELAGVRPIGIQPLRRTVFTFAPPPGINSGRVPLVGDVGANFYFKKEGAHILCSPADETPSPPCDAKVEEIDVARAIDVINAATTFNVRSIRSSWAGLRNFVADRSPVAGFDDNAEGFFWFAGQGGYGIQIAPALAQIGASIVRTGEMPTALAARGLDIAMLGRARLDRLTATDVRQ